MTAALRARRLLALLTLLAATLAAPAGAADDVQVTATLEPRTIPPQGFALLTIEVSGGGLGGRLRATPAFEVENFEPPGAPSRSESFEFRNGETRRTLTLHWRLRPLAVGPARVRGVRVEAGEKTLELPDLAVTVDAAAPMPDPGRRPGSVFPSPFGTGDPFADLFGARQRRRPVTTVTPKVFLRATVKPDRVRAGEQAVYTIRLYTQGDVSAIQPTTMPRFDRFWAREIPVPERPRAEMVEVDGERYGEVTLLQRALFPMRAGTVRIEPFAAEIAVRVASPDPWGGLIGEVESWRRESNAVDLVVDPLPPAPAGFSGAVGRLEFAATLEPARVEVGEAATLTLTLSGVGRLEGMSDPILPPVDGVHLFPPQSQGSDDVRGTTVVGRRVWRYVLVPERADEWTMAPVSLSYFDTERDAYRLAATAPVKLTAVAPAPALGSEAGAVSAAPVAAERPAAAGAPEAGWRTWLPWLLVGALTVALGLALRRRRSPHRGPAALARAEPDPEFRTRLEEALREQRPRPMAAAVESLFQTELARRHSLPAATPAAQWAELLSHNGFGREAIDDIRSLADELHYLRYAPQISAIDALRTDLATRARRVADFLG